MKIAGQDLSRPRTGTITLAGIEVSVRSLPLSFEDELDRELPMPTPRLTPATDRAGRPIRDERTKEFIPIEDVADPKFVREQRRVAQLRFAALIHAALDANPDVEWTAKRENYPDGPKFYDAVYKELLATSVSSQEIQRAIERIRTLGVVSDEEMGAAREGFSPDGRSGAQSGSSPKTPDDLPGMLS